MKPLFLFVLLWPLGLSAQPSVNDTMPLKASLSVTGFWQGGNVETFIFRAKSDLAYQLPNKWVARTQNSYVYQAFGRQKADEDLLSLNFLYFNPEKTVYPQVLGFASSNFRREIQLRVLTGAGVTVQLLKKEDNWLKLSVSSEYEHTTFNRAVFNRTEYNGDSTINTFRGTLWINGKYHLWDKKIVITHESYVQPSLQQRNNYRWQADLGLEFPISSHVSLKVNYLHFFESIVIANQQRDDRLLTFGVTLKNG